MDEQNVQVSSTESMEEVLPQDTVSEEVDYESTSSEVMDGENEETEVDDTFNPEDLFGEEDINTDSYMFGSYNLEKYKDVLDFTDEELTQEFNEQVEAYESRGFTQEQIEFILDEKIADIKEREEKRLAKPSQKEIRERLQQNLSKEEIRNYKPTVTFVKDILSGTEFEDKTNDILQNPVLVKIFHQAYKKSLGRTTNMNSIAKRQESPIKTMSYAQAEKQLQKAFNQRQDVKGVATSLLSSLSGNDKELFLELISAVGIK